MVTYKTNSVCVMGTTGKMVFKTSRQGNSGRDYNRRWYTTLGNHRHTFYSGPGQFYNNHYIHPTYFNDKPSAPHQFKNFLNTSLFFHILLYKSPDRIWLCSHVKQMTALFVITTHLLPTKPFQKPPWIHAPEFWNHFWQRRSKIQNENQKYNLTCNHVSHFNNHTIVWSKLLSAFNLVVVISSQFSSCKLVGREASDLNLQQTGVDGLYPFLPSIWVSERAFHALSVENNYLERNYISGQTGKGRMKIAMNNVREVPFLQVPDEQMLQCTACIQSKTKQTQIASPARRITLPQELVFTYMTGKISMKSLGSAHYLVVLLDRCTNISAVYFINNKCKVMPRLRTYNNLAENKARPPYRRYTLSIDSAGKQSSNEFCSFIHEIKMRIEYSLTRGIQSDRAVQRFISEFWDMARMIFLDSDLPRNYGLMPSHRQIIWETDYHRNESKWAYLKNSIIIMCRARHHFSHLKQNNVLFGTNQNMQKIRHSLREHYLGTSSELKSIKFCIKYSWYHWDKFR